MKIGAKRDGTLVAASRVAGVRGGRVPGLAVRRRRRCASSRRTTSRTSSSKRYDVVVNKPKMAAYRAPGAPMAAFATESLIDEIARTLEHRSDRAPPEERRRAKATRRRTGRRTVRSGSRRCSRRRSSSRTGRAPLGAEAGRGLACGFWFNAGMSSSATVALARRRQRHRGHGQPRHRRHARGAGADGRRGTRHSRRARAAESSPTPTPSATPTSPAAAASATRPAWRSSRPRATCASSCARAPRRSGAFRWSRCGGKTGSAVPRRARRRPSAADGAPISPSSWRRPVGPSSAVPRVNPPMAGPAFAAHICDVEVDRKPAAAASSATPPFRMPARRSIRATSKGRCRAARRRASAGR